MGAFSVYPIANEPYNGWAFSALKFKSEYAPFALWDADFDPPGRNQHPTRQRDGNVWLPCGCTIVNKMGHFLNAAGR